LPFLSGAILPGGRQAEGPCQGHALAKSEPDLRSRCRAPGPASVGGRCHPLPSPPGPARDYAMLLPALVMREGCLGTLGWSPEAKQARPPDPTMWVRARRPPRRGLRGGEACPYPKGRGLGSSLAARDSPGPNQEVAGHNRAGTRSLYPFARRRRRETPHAPGS
jgi:hypothetical protein